jgi:hypothetical protein
MIHNMMKTMLNAIAYNMFPFLTDGKNRTLDKVKPKDVYISGILFVLWFYLLIYEFICRFKKVDIFYQKKKVDVFITLQIYCRGWVKVDLNFKIVSSLI